MKIDHNKLIRLASGIGFSIAGFVIIGLSFSSIQDKVVRIKVLETKLSNLEVEFVKWNKEKHSFIDFDSLWMAVCFVESCYDPNAWNGVSGAGGMAQITPECVMDVGRITGGGNKLIETRDIAISRTIFEVYLRYYLNKDNWPKDQAPPYTMESAARIWNGGPYGWKKNSTLIYWMRVKDKLGKN